MVKIIVDSTCDLTLEYIQKHQIDVISLQVFIEDKSYRDIKEIDIKTLYQAIHDSKDIKTSLPVLTDMDDLFSKYAKEKTPFIFFTFSGALSGTNNAANLIVNDLKEKYDTPMAVIDTKDGGMATALIVKRFIENMDNYKTFDEKIAYALEITDKMRHVFLVNDLTQLRKGGRISRLKALVGSILSIKPVLYIDHNGAIDVYKNAIGQKRALGEMIRYLELNITNKEQPIGINYVESKEVYHGIKKLLNQKGYTLFSEARLASVMTAHIGLDAVSISFFTD